MSVLPAVPTTLVKVGYTYTQIHMHTFTHAHAQLWDAYGITFEESGSGARLAKSCRCVSCVYACACVHSTFMCT